jgi:hypothetical protein
VTREQVTSCTTPRQPDGGGHSAKLISSGRAYNKIEVKIPLKSKTLRIIASESRSTKTLIEKYGAAVARSRMGKSVLPVALLAEIAAIEQ